MTRPDMWTSHICESRGSESTDPTSPPRTVEPLQVHLQSLCLTLSHKRT